MQVWAKTDKYFIGVWLFSHRVSTKRLQHQARQWIKRDPNYLHLYVRHFSNTNQMGLGFIYELTEADTQVAYEFFFNKTLNQLKKNFGDLFVGWDICSRGLLIK